MSNADAIRQAYQQAKAEAGHTGHGFLDQRDDARAESARKMGAELLEKAIANGTRRAGPVIERVLGEMPDDALPPAQRLFFSVEHEAGTTQVGKLVMGWGNGNGDSRTYQDGAAPGEWRPVHRNAFSQLVGQVPQLTTPYLRSLVESGDDWKHRLAESILREHYGHDEARYLVRSQGGEHRALLSSNYRRLDARPLLDAFVATCDAVGAKPYDGLCSDVRVAVRAIVPKVFEVDGDVFCLGLSWQNSDFGVGAYAITGFVLRLLCDNGAMTESELRQIHLGRKLDDTEIFTSKTYELDTKTMASATDDIVRALLSERGLDKRYAQIRSAADQRVEFGAAVRPVKERLSKGELERAKAAFESPDDWNLPAGRTLWRASNALSWIAKSDGVDQDRKIELEQMAGRLLPQG